MKRVIIPLLLSFLLCIGVLFAGCGELPFEGWKTRSESTSSNGIPNIEAAELRRLFPESIGAGKPLVLDFTSRYCLTCQALQPKLEEMIAKKPGLILHRIDITRPSREEKALIRTFNVVSVPYVAFISGDGQIRQVIREDAEAARLLQAGLDIMQ